MSVTPGWHPDPSNPGGAVRWWDGSSWTSHTQPVMAGGSPVAGSLGASSVAGSLGGSGTPAATLPPSPPVWSPAAPTAGYPYAGSASAYPGGAPQMSFAKKNSLSLTAMGVVALYVFIAVATHVVLLGIFPVLLAVRATKSKEQLAPLAIAAAVIAVAVAFFALK